MSKTYENFCPRFVVELGPEHHHILIGEKMEIDALASEGEDSHPLSNLPQAIIFDILSWLPVKSLLKFRCVSKSWLSLISNTHFIKTHLERSKRICKRDRHNLLLNFTDKDGTKNYSCSLYPLLYENSSVNLVEQEFLLLDPSSLFYFEGSCNGLVLVMGELNSLILWNPSTKKYKKLPDSGIDRDRYSCFIYGFGYDELNDDYKVVENCCCQDNGLPVGAKVSVYSLKNNSWKTQDMTGTVVVGGSGVFVNGALHFSVASYENFQSYWAMISSNMAEVEDGEIPLHLPAALGNSRPFWSMVAFNMAEETYGDKPLPEQIAGNVDWSIGILQDHLLVSYHAHQVQTEFWMLKEYNVKESWTKLFTIPCPYGKPIIARDNGEPLLISWKEMIVYNPQDNSSEHYAIDAEGFCTGAVPFSESIVSPDQFGN